MTKKAKARQYEVLYHDLVEDADTIKEAYDQLKSFLVGLKKLVHLEQEGKIRVDCSNASPSFQTLEVLNKLVEPKLQKIASVHYYEIDEEVE